MIFERQCKFTKEITTKRTLKDTQSHALSQLRPVLLNPWSSCSNSAFLPFFLLAASLTDTDSEEEAIDELTDCTRT